MNGWEANMRKQIGVIVALACALVLCCACSQGSSASSASAAASSGSSAAAAAAMADCVVEVVYSIPVVLKGALPCASWP